MLKYYVRCYLHGHPWGHFKVTQNTRASFVLWYRDVQYPWTPFSKSWSWLPHPPFIVTTIGKVPSYFQNVPYEAILCPLRPTELCHEGKTVIVNLSSGLSCDIFLSLFPKFLVIFEIVTPRGTLATTDNWLMA